MYDFCAVKRNFVPARDHNHVQEQEQDALRIPDEFSLDTPNDLCLMSWCNGCERDFVTDCSRLYCGTCAQKEFCDFCEQCDDCCDCPERKMRLKIQETLSDLDEGMLKKIIAILNEPVTFEYCDYSRAAEVRVTIAEGQVTWHVKGTLWRIGRAIEGEGAGKPVEATLKELTIMELCDSDIGQDLCLTYADVMRGLGWSNWGETLYGLPPHADSAIHRLIAY